MTDLWKNKDYIKWINNLKKRFREVQLKTAVKINSELLNFYWELGKEITQKQKVTKWGDKFLESLSKDLMAEFPNVKGFSKRNLEQIRRWYLFWNKAIENGWSRAVLTHQIESGLYERTGKAITNFDITLPKPQSDLAKETYYWLRLLRDTQIIETELANSLVKDCEELLFILSAILKTAKRK
jgi:predicted nuclease of restriction endonuclease-like (RecB) superfamily